MFDKILDKLNMNDPHLRRTLRTCLKSGQFDMIVQKRMITYELPQQSLTAPI